MSRTLVLSLALAASPALAEPLTFGGINGRDDLSASTDLTACRPTTDGLQRCQLARRSFGGLDIVRSEALLRTEGRIRSLRIELDRADDEPARQMMIGRYGPPARWSSFDDGAHIAMARTAQASVISFDFPANATAGARIDMRAVWTVLALISAGLVLGWLAFRTWRRPKRSTEPATLSMKETLERRLAEGRELRF